MGFFSSQWIIPAPFKGCQINPKGWLIDTPSNHLAPFGRSRYESWISISSLVGFNHQFSRIYEVSIFSCQIWQHQSLRPPLLASSRASNAYWICVFNGMWSGSVPASFMIYWTYWSYCWWFRNLAKQLRLVVYPIIYDSRRVFSTFQRVVENGISEASKVSMARQAFSVLPLFAVFGLALGWNQARCHICLEAGPVFLRHKSLGREDHIPKRSLLKPLDLSHKFSSSTSEMIIPWLFPVQSFHFPAFSQHLEVGISHLWQNPLFLFRRERRAPVLARGCFKFGRAAA